MGPLWGRLWPSGAVWAVTGPSTAVEGAVPHFADVAEATRLLCAVWERPLSGRHCLAPSGDVVLSLLVGRPPGKSREVAMSNVDTHRADHAAFNRRAYEDVARTFRDDAIYTDHGRNLTTKGRREFVDWLKGWASAFSDAAVAEPR